MPRSPSSDTRFRRLFDEHERVMREYFSRRLGVNEANDATAEVFLVAWRRLDKVPAGDEARLWLYGVARNVVRNVNRTRRRRDRLDAKLGSTAANPRSGPEELVVRRSEDRLVLDAMARLKPDDAEIVRLSVWEELSHRDIAAVFDISVDAADMRLRRARKRLGRELTALGYNSEHPTRPRAAGEGGAQ